MKFIGRVIIPKGFLKNPQNIVNSAETALDMAAEDIRVDYGVVTQTWNHKPVFAIDKSKLKRRITTGDDVFRYIDKGTAVRRAVMTPGFRPKTIPGQIRSRMGSGGVAYISKKVVKPGIEARRFSEEILKKWTKEFPKLLQQAVIVEVNKMMK